MSDSFALPTYDHIYIKYARMASISYKTILDIITTYAVNLAIDNGNMKCDSVDEYNKLIKSGYKYFEPIIDNNIYEDEIELSTKGEKKQNRSPLEDDYYYNNPDPEEMKIILEDLWSGNHNYDEKKYLKYNTVSFVEWAVRKKVPIPKIFIECNLPNSLENQKTKVNSSRVKAEHQAVVKKTTRPKGYLAEVVGYVYKKLHEQGKSTSLRPSNIRGFIYSIKEMATKNGPHSDEYVLERIKSIVIPEEGPCTIITEDQLKIKGQSENIVRGKTYSNNDIAKILTKLRINNQITE